MKKPAETAGLLYRHKEKDVDYMSRLPVYESV